MIKNYNQLNDDKCGFHGRFSICTQIPDFLSIGTMTLNENGCRFGCVGALWRLFRVPTSVTCSVRIVHTRGWRTVSNRTWCAWLKCGWTTINNSTTTHSIQTWWDPLLFAELVYDWATSLGLPPFIIEECSHLATGCITKCGCLGLILLRYLTCLSVILLYINTIWFIRYMHKDYSLWSFGWKLWTKMDVPRQTSMRRSSILY